MGQFIGELINAALDNDAPSVEDRKILHGIANEIQILLDQEHCTGLIAGDLLDDLVDLLDYRGLQTFGGFVEQKKFWFLR